MKEKLNQLCNKCNLGNVLRNPIMITGGLMHKMYYVITDKGEYAIKILNHDIMQRPEALNNMINSELISNTLKTEILLVTAKEFNGKNVIQLVDSYYIIFDWIEGKSIFNQDISQYHCQQIGKVLGKIHAANIQINLLNKKQNIRKLYNWDLLLEQARKQEVEWYLLFKKSFSKIKQWDKATCDSTVKLLDYQVISHRDIDPKNVIWKNDVPYIIDWEAAGYINPFQELVEVLNYWTKDSLGNYDKKKFNATLEEYTKMINVKFVDWETIIHSGFDGMLGWLEYNVKRALGIECTADKERELGKEQLIATINELNEYYKNEKQLMALLNEYVL